MPPQPETT
jgi:hypothetical protein